MLKLRRTWQEEKMKFTQIKYVERDFYGPWVDLLVEQQEEILPIVEVEPGSYGFENASVAEGINVTMVKAAKEIYDRYGEFLLVTKFGIIPIISRNTEKAIAEFQKKITLF